MMPLSLFRVPRFLAANLLTFLLYGALGGSLYVIPFYLIQVRHYPPAAAGAVFLPLIALMFLFSARVGALVPRLGERLLLCLGAALAGAGFAAFAWLDNLNGYFLSVFPAVLILGCGMTLCVAPLTNAVMSSVAENQTGIASAVNNAISRLAGLVAVSLLALLLAHGFEANLTAQLAHSGLPAEVRAQFLNNRARLHDIPIPAGLPPGQRAQAAALLDGAFLAGFRLVMLACAVSSWSGGLAVLLLLPGSNLSQGHGKPTCYGLRLLRRESSNPGGRPRLPASNHLHRQGGSMKSSLALFAVLGLLPMAQAQTTPHTPPTPAMIAQHQVQRYTTLLSLNANQVEQATTIFTTEATAEQNVRTTERAAHQAMETAIKANDTATIQSTSTSLGSN